MAIVVGMLAARSGRSGGVGVAGDPSGGRAAGQPVTPALPRSDRTVARNASTG